jgi:hypothetical protein
MEGMGVPATLIQKASDYFLYFDVEKFFSKLLNEKGWSEHIEKIKRTEQVKALLKYSLIDLSRFSLLFFDILNGKTVSFLLGEELCEEIVIDRDEKKVDHDLSKKFHQIVSRLHTNFYCFSLNDLLKEIYIGPKSDLDYFENVSILSKEEAEIISALREAGLREVKVKLGKEGAIELLSKVSHLQIESVKRKVRGLSKKGTVNIMEMVYDEEENLRMAIKTEQIKFKKAKK